MGIDHGRECSGKIRLIITGLIYASVDISSGRPIHTHCFHLALLKMSLSFLECTAVAVPGFKYL